MDRITICTNGETLTDSYDIENCYDEEAIAVASEAANRCFCQLTGEYGSLDTDSFFPNWHGGKYDQFYTRAGFVAFADKADRELAEKIDEAMKDALNEFETELAADAARAMRSKIKE